MNQIRETESFLKVTLGVNHAPVGFSLSFSAICMAPGHSQAFGFKQLLLTAALGARRPVAAMCVCELSYSI